MQINTSRIVLPAMTTSVLVGIIVGTILCFVLGCEGEPVHAPTARAVTPEEKLVREYMTHKNARKQQVNDLLGPPPVIPATAVTKDEGQRLDTEIFLRRDYRILEVRPEEKPGRFVLVVEGNLMSEKMRVGTDGPGVRQIVNPDLIVEVRDGKIYGVLAQLHQEPNRRPLTRAEAARLRRILTGE